MCVRTRPCTANVHSGYTSQVETVGFSSIVRGVQLQTDVDDCGGVYIAWRACIGCSNDAWHVSSHLSETGGDGGAKRTSVGCACGVFAAAGCQVKLLSVDHC